MTKIDVSGVGQYIREQRSQAEMSLRQLADSAGVSNPYLSQVERGLRKPSAEILCQIAKGLRISAETLYVKAGILPEIGQGNVLTALELDGSISDRQRQVLVEIYSAFRAENRVERPVSSGESLPGSRREDRGTHIGHLDSASQGRAFESGALTTIERDD